MSTSTHMSMTRALSLLNHIAEGAAKHAKDPGFPDLGAIADPAALHDELASALMAMNAAREQSHKATGVAHARSTEALVAIGKLTAQIQIWCGKRSELLRDFGLAPHKPYHPRPRKAHPAKAKAHGAASGSGSSGSEPGGGSTPAPASSGGTSGH